MTMVFIHGFQHLSLMLFILTFMKLVFSMEEIDAFKINDDDDDKDDDKDDDDDDDDDECIHD